VLIRIETKAGHGAGKPTAKVIEEVRDNADDISSIQEAEILKSKFGNISGKERETVIQARRGQGLFRKQVIDYWSTCAVTWVCRAFSTKGITYQTLGSMLF
jgi:hypothetical protein